MTQSWFADVRSALLYVTVTLLSTRKIFIVLFSTSNTLDTILLFNVRIVVCIIIIMSKEDCVSQRWSLQPLAYDIVEKYSVTSVSDNYILHLNVTFLRTLSEHCNAFSPTSPR